MHTSTNHPVQKVFMCVHSRADDPQCWVTNVPPVQVRDNLSSAFVITVIFTHHTDPEQEISFSECPGTSEGSP